MTKTSQSNLVTRDFSLNPDIVKIEVGSCSFETE